MSNWNIPESMCDQSQEINRLQSELTAAKAENEAFRGRVAELYSCDAHQDLLAIHRVTASVSEAEPASEEDALTVRRAKEMASLINQMSSQIDASKAEIESLWETFVKVADCLGIDPEQARKIPGKPSQVFRAAMLRKQAEAITAASNEAHSKLFESGMLSKDSGTAMSAFMDYADRLRQQADELEQ